MNRRHQIMLAAALVVSPTALLSIPGAAGAQDTPAPAITEQPQPVYASTLSTTCTSWYVTGKGMVGKLVFPWSSFPVYLRSNYGGTRTVYVSAQRLASVSVGQYWETVCGGGGSWNMPTATAATFTPVYPPIRPVPITTGTSVPAI